MSNPVDQRLRWARAILALLILTGGGLGLWLLGEYRHLHQQRAVRLWQPRLDQAVNLRDAGFPLGNHLWRFILDTRQSFGDQERWREHQEGINQSFGCRLEFQEFQSGIRVLFAPAAGASYTRELALLVEALRWSPEQYAASREAYELATTRFFGRPKPLAELQRRNGEFQLAFPGGRPALVFLERRQQGRGFAICAYNLRRESVREYQKWNGKIRSLRRLSGFGWPSQGFWVPPPGQSEQSMRQAYESPQREGTEVVNNSGFLWMFLEEEMGRVFALAVPYRMPDIRLPALVMLLLLGGAWLQGGRLINRLLMVRDADTAIVSLRTQFRLVLGGIILVPLLAGLGLSWYTLQGQEEKRRNQAYAEGLARLRVVESGLTRFFADSLTGFRSLCRYVNEHPTDLASMTSLTQPLEQAELLNNVVVLDARHNVLFRNFGADREDMLMMIDNLARSGVRRFTPHRVPVDEQNRVKPIDVLMDSLSSAEELGYSQISGRPDRLLSLGVSGGRTYVYWNVFPGLATGPAFLCGGQEPELYLTGYLQRLIKGDPSGTEINGVFLAHLDVFPERGAAWNREMQKLAQLTERTRRVQQRQLTIEGKTVWAVAMNDSLINRFSWILVRDADRELAALGVYRLGMLMGVFLAFIMAWVSGSLLGSLLLNPISDLERGIEALRARDTAWRIPVRRDDEFGALARLFNHSLLELKELELARVVQTSLLPKDLPALSGYSMSGSNMTASDLGGDYYDFLATSGGADWIMCIGDVTGHGASAALAMAMAKAALTYRLNQGETAPQALLDSLNQVFYRELRGSRKFMTMVLTRFCPATGELHLENAGHNYPLLFRTREEKSEFLPMIGPPLGVKRKASRDSCTVTLARGDAILYYTDGFTECPVPGGDFIGDEAMRQHFDRLCRAGADGPEIIAGLLQELHRCRIPGPLLDDVTLVVVKRKEEGCET